MNYNVCVCLNKINTATIAHTIYTLTQNSLFKIMN